MIKIFFAVFLIFSSMNLAYGLYIVADIGGQPLVKVYQKPVVPGITDVSMQCVKQINGSGNLYFFWEPTDTQQKTSVALPIDFTGRQTFEPRFFDLIPNTNYPVLVRFTFSCSGIGPCDCAADLFFVLTNPAK